MSGIVISPEKEIHYSSISNPKSESESNQDILSCFSFLRDSGLILVILRLNAPPQGWIQTSATIFQKLVRIVKRF